MARGKSWSNCSIVIIIVIRMLGYHRRRLLTIYKYWSFPGIMREYVEYIKMVAFHLVGMSGQTHSYLSLIHRIGTSLPTFDWFPQFITCLQVLNCNIMCILMYLLHSWSWIYLFSKLNLTSSACYSISLLALLLFCFLGLEVHSI